MSKQKKAAVPSVTADFIGMSCKVDLLSRVAVSKKSGK